MHVNNSIYVIFLAAAFGLYFTSGLAFGYIASYALLKVVAYLSPWMPTWMWMADIGLYFHAVALAATSAVGVIGAIAKRAKAINLCMYILISLLLVEIGVTVQLATRSDSLGHALKLDMEEAMELSLQHFSHNSTDALLWNEIQLENNCCGVSNYTDWYSTIFGDGKNVPDSCCLLVTKGCGRDIAHSQNPEDTIITEGCLPTFTSAMKRDFQYYGHTIWLRVLLLQVLLMVIIVILSKKIRARVVHYSPYTVSGRIVSPMGSKYQLLSNPYC